MDDQYLRAESAQSNCASMTRDELVTELSAALGYLMNARIDLETGCTKATAIRTLSGGIKRVQKALEAAKVES